MTADRITVAELQELLAAGQPVTVLDVRSPSDVDWEIPGAIHVDAYADLQSSRLGPLAELDLSFLHRGIRVRGGRDRRVNRS